MTGVSLSRTYGVTWTSTGRFLHWGNFCGISTPLPTGIFLGNSHQVTCASTSRDFCIILTREGNVFSWGENQYGQLGHGDYETQKVPKKIRGTLLDSCHVTQIATGRKHTIAQSRDGRIFVWGAAEDGKKKKKKKKILKKFFFFFSLQQGHWGWASQAIKLPHVRFRY